MSNTLHGHILVIRELPSLQKEFFASRDFSQDAPKTRPKTQLIHQQESGEIENEIENENENENKNDDNEGRVRTKALVWDRPRALREQLLLLEHPVNKTSTDNWFALSMKMPALAL